MDYWMVILWFVLMFHAYAGLARKTRKSMRLFRV